ncbi:energy-coupling factor transport system ATP-binding protein [Thalassobacillus cyri]|uniref:Energy-coupling factor transport system ATP-binding protein n=1 Tax=Thalassobacillus cyri TaxID=571932 RepID=A0A1H4FSL6_9BACI|nr:ABC transporter ATP-binding protein [Thalassobacillus cyri]SEB00339.1 energy-coupling factor transport system ATP-binding protein [Thalassobacillus cyri]
MAPHDKPLIEVHQLTLHYEEAKSPTLNGIDFCLSHGETALLLGPSGSGKSTLTYCLNGLYPGELDGSMNGKRYYQGVPFENFEAGELSQRVGVVFQDPESQFCMLTVEDEIAFGLENLKTAPEIIREKVDRALEMVGLMDVKEAEISTLSGGMKQKLALACVLAMEPELLILDEPTSLLDPHARRSFIETVVKLQEENDFALLIIEHNLDEWLPYGDRCLLINSRGEIFYDGSIAQGFYQHYEAIKSEGIWVPELFRTAQELSDQGLIELGGEYPVRLESLAGNIPETLEYKPAELLSETKYIDSSRETHLSLQNIGYKHILGDITTEIKEGEWAAIIGANGAGKTTLSLLMAGLLHSSTGNIQLNNKAMADYREHLLWQEIGYVFQNPEYQFVADTVFEEVAFGLRLQEIPEKVLTEKTNHLLDRYGLLTHADRHPYTLSQGQKRRLSIATMMVEHQSLLILDEPTFGQDERAAAEIIDLLEARNQAGTTLVMVTHDMELVEQHADHVIVVDKGKVAFEGSPSELWQKNNHWLEQHHLQKPFRVRLEEAARKREGNYEFTGTQS